jgi:hypothetical protein
MSLNVRDSIAYLNAMSFTSGNLGTSENLGNNLVMRDADGNFSAEDVDVNQITAENAILGTTTVTDLTTTSSSSYHVMKQYSTTSDVTIDAGVTTAIVKNTRTSTGNIIVSVPGSSTMDGPSVSNNTVVLAMGEIAMIHLTGYDTNHYVYTRVAI